jgi:hypothetical protein
VDLAGKSDAAVVIVGYGPDLGSEGFDRKSMDLPKGQVDLIRAAAANKNTVGINVGYRRFDAGNIQPLFPFGHGLSYTTFEYSNLTVTPAKVATGQSAQVRFMVRNSESGDS